MTTTTPQVSHPFPDKIVIILQLVAQHIQSISYAKDTLPDKWHHRIADYFAAQAKAMGFSPVRRLGRYKQWTAKLGKGELTACYGIRRQRNSDGGISVWIELNPSKATAQHVAQIENDIVELLGTSAPFSSLLKFARVYELHVAIDIQGRVLSGLYIVGRNAVGSILRHGGSKCRVDVWLSEEHGWETQNFRTGEEQSRIAFAAYNKSLEQHANKKLNYDQGNPITRLEHKLVMTKRPLASLFLLPNYFACTGVVDLDGLKGWHKKRRMGLFADTVRVRGLAAATKRHGQAVRDQWDNLISSDASWWTPQALWKKWPASLSKYPIAKWIHAAAQQWSSVH